MKRKRKPEDEPYTDNYPPLKAWLNKHNGRCVEQVRLNCGTRAEQMLEVWNIGNGSVVIRVWAERAGWDIFTAHASNSIELALNDAELRLGIGT